MSTDFVEKVMALKASRGWTAGTQNPSTPSQGTGGHSPDATRARVITGADRPGVIEPVPKMAPNSKDGVVRTPQRHDSQGWYRNEDVRQVDAGS
jgi:hypothetical protein